MENMGGIHAMKLKMAKKLATVKLTAKKLLIFELACSKWGSNKGETTCIAAGTRLVQFVTSTAENDHPGSGGNNIGLRISYFIPTSGDT